MNKQIFTLAATLVILTSSCLFLPPPPEQQQADSQQLPPPPQQQPPQPTFQPNQPQAPALNPPAAASECPSNTFIDVSNQPNVELRVTCQGDTMTVETNNIPNFQVPGTTTEQVRTWYIPLNPQVNSQPTDLPKLDAVAVAVNGVQIHGPNGADFDDYPDPVYEGMTVACGGHHAERTIFHFHGRPDCLLPYLVQNSNDTSQLVGVVLGYAFDGFPILSPYICDQGDCSKIRKVTSSWQHVKDVTNAWEANQFVAGSGDLDQCNGMVGADGSYAYYATDTFPYNLGCYQGTPDTRNFRRP